MLRKINFRIVQAAIIGLLALGLLLVPTDTVSAQETIELRGNQPTLEQIAYALNHTDDKSLSYNFINQLDCSEVDSTDLSGKTFQPGVYCLASADLAGRMTLDAGGDAAAIFIFRIAGGFNVKNNSDMALTNGAAAANVHFVADSASIEAGSEIKGNIFTKDAINIADGALVKGSTVAVSGDVKAPEASAGVAVTGTLEICKRTAPAPGVTTDTRLNDRVFTFTVTAGGVTKTIPVPANQCSGPINVPVGTATIQELNTGTFINAPGTFTGGFQLSAVNVISQNSTSTVTGQNLSTRTVTTNIVEGGIGQQLMLEFVNRFAIAGFVEICKRAAIVPGTNNTPDPDVTGFFNFTVQGVFQADGRTLQTFTAPVGGCTPPIPVLIGNPSPTGDPLRSTVDITELANVGAFLESATTIPAGRLTDLFFNIGENANGNAFINIGGGIGRVVVFEGGAALETTVNFFNRSNPAIAKVCKVAGPGIPLFTPFRFQVAGNFGSLNNNGQTPTTGRPLFGPFGNVGPITVDVLAGDPATGGNCVAVPGFGGTGTDAGLQTFANGTPVLVYELGAVVNGVVVTSLPARTINGQTFPAGDIRVSQVGSSSGFSPVPVTVSGVAGSPTITLTSGTGNPDLTPRGAGVAPPATDPARLGTAIVPARASVFEVAFTDFVFAPAQLKICKVAGQGVAVGTPFTFTVALQSPLGQNGVPLFPAFSTQVTVQAGPAAQGGFCTFVEGAALNGLLGGAFNQGQTYTITETATPGVVVTGITSRTSDVGVNLAGRQATISGANGIVAGINEVSFTNTSAAFTNLGTTAASVSVSGRVITTQGRGIINVVVTMTDSEGNTRSTVSTTSGYYRFDEVKAGSTYVITATGKHYTFIQPAQVVNISDETEEINFIANSVKRYRM